MTLRVLLSLLSCGLLSLATVFGVMAIRRSTRLQDGGHYAAGKAERNIKRERVRARLDFSCAAGLVIFATAGALACAFGSGPTFSEPTGNFEGGLLLVGVLLLVVLLISLVVRHILLRRLAPRG